MKKNGSTYNISLIEDDRADALLIQQYLQRVEVDFKLQRYVKITEFINSGAAENTDLILLDLNLPDYKNLDGLTYLVGLFPMIPIVVLTATKEASFALESLRLGAQDFLHKGEFDAERLQEILLFSLERKKIENKIAKKIDFISDEKLLKKLMDNIPDSIYFKDIRSRFIKVNDATVKKFNKKSDDEILGKSDLDLFGEVHAGAAYRDEQNIIKTGEPIVAKVEREVWKDGTVSWVSTTKLPLYNEVGEIIGTFGISRDITEQIKSEDKYKLAKERIELLFRIVPSAIFTVDKNRLVTSWNNMAEEITGYKREEMIGKSCEVFAVDPCSTACGLFTSNLKKPLCGKDCTIRTKHGELKHIIKNIEEITDQDGNVSGGIETFIDVTELKETEKKLTNSERKFRSIWEHANEGMRITDAEGKILMVNDAFCRMVRKPAGELIGSEFTIVFSAENQEAISRYKDKFKLNRIVPRFETEIELWDGAKFWFSIFSSYIEWDDGKKVLLSVFRDVTEAKKSEIIQNVIFEINNAIYEIYDFKKLLAKIHHTLSKIVSTESFFIALYNKENDTIDIPYSIDQDGVRNNLPIKDTFTGYVIKTKDSLLVDEEESMAMVTAGEAKIVGKPSKIWLGVPIKIKDEVFGVVVIQDYHDRNAIGIEQQVMIEYVSDQIGLALERIISRRKLVSSEKMLREANDAKDRFFSIISHDLRNPFITLDSFLKILSEDYDDFSESEKKEYLNILYKTSQRTLSLLDNLLTWSRSQRGVIKLKKERVNLKKLSEDSIAALIETASRKKIEILQLLDENIYLTVDIFMIGTVIRNLVSNAIKFTEPGGTITISASDEKGGISLIISDTGIGMTEKTISELFRVDISHTSLGTSNEEGTGLGLILCKDFTEKNNGTIKVESSPGNGSKFILHFPE